MRSDIFTDWLNYLDNYFRTLDRKILLLVDNAGSHFNPKVFEQDDEGADNDNQELGESSEQGSSKNNNKNKKTQKKSLILILLISN